jgi:hypothetical protein
MGGETGSGSRSAHERSHPLLATHFRMCDKQGGSSLQSTALDSPANDLRCPGESADKPEQYQRIGEHLSTRYQEGSLTTAKAFTGQEADPLTGLYYY